MAPFALHRLPSKYEHTTAAGSSPLKRAERLHASQDGLVAEHLTLRACDRGQQSALRKLARWFLIKVRTAGRLTLHDAQAAPLARIAFAVDIGAAYGANGGVEKVSQEVAGRINRERDLRRRLFLTAYKPLGAPSLSLLNDGAVRSSV